MSSTEPEGVRLMVVGSSWRFDPRLTAGLLGGGGGGEVEDEGKLEGRRGRGGLGFLGGDGRSAFAGGEVAGLIFWGAWGGL